MAPPRSRPGQHMDGRHGRRLWPSPRLLARVKSPSATGEYLAKRNKAARAHFAELVRNDTAVSPSADPLTLAVGTFFACSTSPARTFAGVLRHKCSDGMRHTWPDDSPLCCASRALFHRQNSWSSHGYYTLAQKAARAVRAYGLDPAAATAEEMDASRVRIVCPKHSKGWSGTSLTVHSWRSVVCPSMACVGVTGLTVHVRF